MTDKSVLGSLPNTRPARMGGARAPKPEQTAASRPRTRAGTKPRPAPKRRPTPPPEPPRRPSGPPTGPELVTTAVQAVGEVAQIGASAAVRTAKGALRRLPRVW